MLRCLPTHDQFRVPTSQWSTVMHCLCWPLIVTRSTVADFDVIGRDQARAESVICDIERLYALSQALVSEVKEELIRLVGFTKKAQKVANAPGMEASVVLYISLLCFSTAPTVVKTTQKIGLNDPLSFGARLTQNL